MIPLPRDFYVRALLALYCGLPHTAARRPSASDRRLANQLFDQGIPLPTVEEAFLLAVARRSTRRSDLPPLPPIHSLAYFLPVIDELRNQHLDPDYLLYLRARCDNQVQIPTDPGER